MDYIPTYILIQPSLYESKFSKEIVLNAILMCLSKGPKLIFEYLPHGLLVQIRYVAKSSENPDQPQFVDYICLENRIRVFLRYMPF